MTAISFSWTEPNGASHPTSVQLNDGTWVDPQLPIVILLHGLGGNLAHMATPSASPGMNFNLTAPVPALIDRGWHTYPNVGVWSVEADATKAVTGWQPFLQAQRYSSVNYGQIDPNGLLARPIVELDALVRAVLAQTTKRLVFICHSRGGLLLRAFIQRNRNDPLLQRIAGAVTLHSPHQGTGVADLVSNIHGALILQLSAVAAPLRPPLLFLDSLVSAPGIAELRTSSPLLASLRTQEQTPLPVSIPIHTFGGTSSRLTRVRTWWFDAMSAVPQWNWPPFHWQTFPGSVAGIASLIDGVRGLATLAPEETMGVGDTLVTDARSHLPQEASHRTNALNHAEALWDTTLKGQVLPILHGFS